MKPLPKLEPGWEYLWKVKPHVWVELSNGKVVEVWSQEGVETYIRGTGTDLSLKRIDALQVVKLVVPITINKDNSNESLPVVQRHTKRSRGQA